MKKRRKFTSEFKSKVALEALREQQQIGQLQVEVDFLKDSCDKLGVSIPEDELR